ncbi:unnamed protein product [Effrenium voratum]|nr:unnamed protein product [Effrenium voratum]
MAPSWKPSRGWPRQRNSRDTDEARWTRRNSETPPTSLSTKELLMAVQALYYEEAHPQDVLVQWWLHQSGHRASIEEIEAAAASSKKLKVQPASTTRKGFSVMLQDPPSWFQGFDEDLVEQIPLDIHEEATMMVLAGGWPEPALANHDRFNIADRRLACWMAGVAAQRSPAGATPELGPRPCAGKPYARQPQCSWEAARAFGAVLPL